ncbi:hypothetical protein [uncultured Nostoc sp.]|uniref:hypothetical protein n=1 Tax=uncultured Nostoc sp. TaxID=340711 RepID=UPI0035C9A4E3
MTLADSLPLALTQDARCAASSALLPKGEASAKGEDSLLQRFRREPPDARKVAHSVRCHAVGAASPRVGFTLRYRF